MRRCLRSAALFAYNSPVDQVPLEWDELVASHMYSWFYSGADDPLLRENRQFADLLSQYGIQHQFLVVPNEGHSWRLWRAQESQALLAASSHLTPAQG